MELHPLPGSLQPSRVDQGWARSIAHGRMTVQEVLERASRWMDEQDEAEAYRHDPIAYIQAWRRKHTLWGRLTGGRGTWR
jgi:hypothetical protein